MRELGIEPQRPRLEPGSRTRSTVGQVAPMLPLEPPPTRAQQRAEYDAAQRSATRPRAAPAHQPPSNQFAEAGQYGLEMTGLPSVRRSARAFASGDMQTGVEEGVMGALGVGSLLVGGQGARAPRPSPPMRAPVAEPGALRPPIRPVQEIGRASDGSVMPVRPPEPFRNSLRGGSDDLAEAARLGALRPAPDGSPSAGARVSDLQSRADPFGPVNLWDENQPPITVAEVRRAMQRGRGEARDYTNTDTQGWSREDHINRIATLARDGWADPIDLSSGGGVHDGLHRLAAAIVRGDETIATRTRQGVFGHGDGGTRQGPRIENANGSWQIVDENGAVLERLPRGRTFRDADAALQRMTSRGPSQ